MKEIQNREGCGSALSPFIYVDSIYPSTFIKTNQGYQLPENLPAPLHEKTLEIMEKPKTPLASQTPNNPTKEFWLPHEIQDVHLDFASFPQLPLNLLLCICYKARYL
jgi:hypothetical protein